MDLWTDKKPVLKTCIAISIVAAISGAILGVIAVPFSLLENELLNRIVSALLLTLLFFVSAYLIVVILGFMVISIVEVIISWIKSKSAKSLAYYMIESGRIGSPNEELKEVVSALRKWNDREARHLLNNLLKAMSTHDLEILETKCENPGVIWLIDEILEARAKATKKFQG